MDHRNLYKAIIVEPNRKPSEPDYYGTLTVQSAGVSFGKSSAELVKWAKEILPKLTEGAYCVIYRIDEVEVCRVKKEDVGSAVQTDAGSHS